MICITHNSNLISRNIQAKEETMTNDKIVPNPLFSGSFIYRGEEYANYQSALAAAGLDTRFRSYVPEAEFEQVTLSCKAFVSPSGQYYVVVPCGSIDVRVDCANVHTARAWQRDGVSVASFREAMQEDSWNVRPKGHWGAC
jgi:hypothetical protein